MISVPHRSGADIIDDSDDSSCHSIIDYSEKRSLPITVPDYQFIIDGNGQKYTVCVVEDNNYKRLL